MPKGHGGGLCPPILTNLLHVKLTHYRKRERVYEIFLILRIFHRIGLTENEIRMGLTHFFFFPPFLASFSIFSRARRDGEVTPCSHFETVDSLRIGDLKTYRNQAVVDVIGKGKKFRRIPLHPEALAAIRDYLKASGNGTDPDHSIFNTLGKHGPYEERGLTPKAVDCLIKSVATKALIKKRIHPHVIRHTFATTLLDKGNDLRTVQVLMGHSHIRTTEAYLHNSTDDRKVEAIESLQFGV